MAAQHIQPITYIIGINKLGTLLSSQTTDTFEYSRNNSFSNEFPFRISSLRCFKLISFDFTFANPAVFPEFTQWNEIHPAKSEAFRQSMRSMFENRFSIFVGSLSPLSGGDSENNTRPSAAAQIGCRVACRW
ncbi:hypothetical protein [Pseudarthrobacter enclensis]|uniref:hypothetical protein n=1 Tax=Pseudarthrobacter enclensis TaxID=993070 RepID=UPI0011469184|nr:hypothetical protein [Pseudarthrobacter enclensis]